MTDTDELRRWRDALDFVRNRLDGVASDVIRWMPDEDNEKHHHAVEMLGRAYQVAMWLQDRIAKAEGDDVLAWWRDRRGTSARVAFDPLEAGALCPACGQKWRGRDAPLPRLVATADDLIGDDDA